MLEDIKEVISSRKPKERQYNDRKTKEKINQ